MKHYSVDYESYYSKEESVSVSTQGTARYLESSYAYLVSIVGEDIKEVGTPDEIRAKYGEAFWTNPEHQFWAANSNFDQAWTEKLFWKSARPWKCILDRGAVQQMPGNLAGLAYAVTGTKVDKKLRDWMNGRHFKDITPEEQQQLREYCLNDSVEEYEILKKLPDPSPVEDALAEHTRAVNRRGIHIDVDLLEADMTRLQHHRHAGFVAIPWHNDDKPLSLQALAKYCNAKGLPVPESLDKRDEDCIELLNVHPALNDVVGAMRKFRRANTLIRKIESIQARITSDNRIPLEMLYCGARHTRRWSCRGVNIQNLDREPLQVGQDSVWSRNWLVPPPGKLFLSLDYAQVEPRCLNWMVENDPLLDLIRAGYSVYEAYARVAKGWKGDKGTLKKEIGVVRYTLIKNEVLGLGYGMGAARYAGYAGVDPKVAKRTVEDFRRANPKILMMWKRLDEGIRQAALNQTSFSVEMPTGEYLHQFGVRANKYGGYESWTIKTDFTHNSHQGSLWGGTATENITQRMARDAMGAAIIRLEKAGFTIAFTVHDEIVIVIDKDNQEDAQAEAERLTSITPEWAPGLPLGVEGGISERYTK